MASIQKSFKYDVFLSFRGEDTRKNFVDHLYHALKQRGIYTYKDDEEIKKGEKINDELIRSIEDSKIFIIVFSKNYASSSWCLDELVKIMECQKTNEQTAYPVFYDVEPTEIRNQSGAVGHAFAKHVNAEAAGKWRDALNEAASLAGRELKNTFDGHEAKFIQKIVEEISLELRFINSSVDGKLIGMDTRVKDVISSLEIGIENVRMIGIKGMGGVGKTTLARAVFDKISFQFEGSSFVENVREFSKNSLLGLKSLQKQILSDVLQDTNIVVKGVSDLKKKLCGRKALVVLDDVDNIDQLEALAGEPSWFKRGSRVIITTRDEQVLLTHQVNLILDANLLSYEEAICLFIRYAFGSDIPNQSYNELSNQVVRYAAGLPLTIKVLGSFLCGKGEPEWKDALGRLKTIPLKQTLEVLELSYNSLEEDFKEIFLDVACILKGWEKEEAIIALESCNYHARIGLRVLQQKSLITLSDQGYLGMHDHIEEMGQNIVRRLHPNEPYKHSRLWIAKEIRDIFVEDKGTEATRCIKVRKVGPVNVMKGLRKMNELRLLDVATQMKVNDVEYSSASDYNDDADYDYDSSFGYFNCYNGDVDIDYNDDVDLHYMNVDEDSLYLPNGLQYLYWYGYPFTCLPKEFHAKNLVGLKIHSSNIDQLWEAGEKKDLKKLKFIDFTHCKLRSLDIRLIQNLKRLKLECENLTELHVPVEGFKLESLILNNSKLRTLDLSWARNIVMLNVERCEYLVALHMPVESPNLKHLRLQCSKLKTLKLTCALNLEEVDLTRCKHLEQLQMPIEKFNLKSICIKQFKLRTLNLTWAENLKNLKVEDCEDLEELHMPAKSLELNSIIMNGCSKVRILELGQCPNLRQLDLQVNYNLVEIHAPVVCLQKCDHINISSCVRFKHILFNRWFPEVGLRELHLTARSLDTCSLHPDNNMPKLGFEYIYDLLPTSIIWTGNFEKLISFGPCACTNLSSFSKSICGLQRLRKLTIEGSIQEVPSEIHRLECLENLYVWSTKIEHLPDSICLLKHLKFLRLQSCWLLEQLPEDLGMLECLEELYLMECTFLRDIPKSICEMKCLIQFHLQDCILLEKLPEEIGRLKCLKGLNIKGTGISHLPLSIFELKGLLIIGDKQRLESYGFTSHLKRTTYTSFYYYV